GRALGSLRADGHLGDRPALRHRRAPRPGAGLVAFLRRLGSPRLDGPPRRRGRRLRLARRERGRAAHRPALDRRLGDPPRLPPRRARPDLRPARQRDRRRRLRLLGWLHAARAPPPRQPQATSTLLPDPPPLRLLDAGDRLRRRPADPLRLLGALDGRFLPPRRVPPAGGGSAIGGAAYPWAHRG